MLSDKNLEICGNEIDKSEWAKTIDVLKQINAERQQAGKASIFRNNDVNLVYSGDEINFDKNEITRIYNAMGVTLKGQQQVVQQQVVQQQQEVQQQQGVPKNKRPTSEYPDMKKIFNDFVNTAGCKFDKKTNTYSYKKEIDE